MVQEVELCHFRGSRLVALGVVSLHEGRADAEPRLSLGCADEVEHGVESGQWLACPVLGDLTEESVFDGIPLGGARRIVAR